MLILLWCMANQETTRLVADRLNDCFSRISREDYRGEHGTGIVYKMVQKFSGNPVKPKKGSTSKGITFFPENFHRNELFHLNSYRNFLVFRTNGKRALSLSLRGTSRREPWERG